MVNHSTDLITPQSFVWSIIQINIVSELPQSNHLCNIRVDSPEVIRLDIVLNQTCLFNTGQYFKKKQYKQKTFEVVQFALMVNVDYGCEIICNCTKFACDQNFIGPITNFIGKNLWMWNENIL